MRTALLSVLLALGFAAPALAAPEACMPSAYRSSSPIRYMLVPGDGAPRLTVSQNISRPAKPWVSPAFPTLSGSTFAGSVDFTSPPGVAPTAANLRPDHIKIYLAPAENPLKTPYRARNRLVFSLVLDGKTFGPWPMKVESSASWTSFGGAITTRSADWGNVLPARTFDTFATAFLKASSRQVVIADGAEPMVRMDISAAGAANAAALAWGQKYWAGYAANGACPNSRF